MRIALISNANTREPYGQFTRPTHIADVLVSLGNEVVNYCREEKETTRGPVKIVPKQARQSSRFPFTVLNAYRLYRNVKAFRPDIIYAHEPNNALIADRIAGLLHVPWVFDSHGSITYEQDTYGNDLDRAKETESRILMRAWAIIVVSADLKDIYLRYFDVPAKKIHVCVTSVDVDEFKPYVPPEDVVKRVRGGSKDLVLHMTAPGSFYPNEIALEHLSHDIIPLLDSKVKDYKVLVAGGGIKTKVKSDHVRFLGHVTSLPDFINASDICISPYPNKAICGGVRNKILDYFACCKPVVSTTMGMMGINEAKDKVHYLMANEPSDFVDRIIQLRDDEALGNS
jgi:glycosyltransferase involved in cell wall biosynthesis